MATSGSKGSGFSIGIIYGLIVSGILFAGLVYVFPVNTGNTSAPPEVMESAGVALPTSGPDVTSEPQALDATVTAMAQPDAGGNADISVGGAGDEAPVVLGATRIAGESNVNAPAVETQSASVPDIGLGSSEAAEPASNAVASVENNAELPAQTPVSEPVAAPTELAQSASGPAIEVFAVPFTGDTTKPMLAIVLEDTLETSLQPLVDTGKPFSFALPADVESSASAQSIRENGFEVVAMIPAGTSRTEGVAENIARFMRNVPVAVAILDSDSAALMLNRDSMREILETTAPAGLGLIAFSRNGELIARLQAERAGVLYGSALQILEDFDDEALILQALNQAAFVAGTNDRAIVFAKTNTVTINAIVRWLDSPRAAQVEIVPVSVILQRIAN